ncbi:MAG: hypothetical protein EOO61_01700 [Hymenobacter sp.]|nr:MAG: hypothetical protein EOO61_01700 [Hymenobacter sp.]
MTTDPTGQESAEDSSHKEVDFIPERDNLLQDLVDMTNMFPENKIGVTLQMAGILVSGIIIAGDEFYRLFADQLASPGSEVHKEYVLRGDRYKVGRETQSGEEQSAAMGHTAFIHLKDCTLWQGSIGNGIGVPLWRGRIANVDAFWRGILERTN